VHGLFWKFFLSFWAALIVFAAASVLATSHYLDHLREQQDATTPHEQLARNLEAAQAAADRAGLGGLRSWAREMDRRQAVPWLVIDDQGLDVLGRRVPESLLQHLERRAARRPPPGDRPERRPRPVVRLADGTSFWLTPDFRAVTLGRVLRRPRVMALPLLLAAVVSALVCLALARYLTAPIKRLQQAAEVYAGGNLDHRVAPTLGGRRDEIADLARAYDRMAERLSGLLQSQQRLLRDVSPELRSPLARLQAALGLARQRAGAAARPELDRIEREAERLNALIGEVLSLARLDAGVPTPAPELLDLGELLTAIVNDAALEARARGCEVHLEMTGAATVSGSPALLHSALENLVRNAVRYTAAGTAVVVSTTVDPERPGWIAIRVRDRGPGVPEDMLPHLFEPFVRVDEARDRASGGHGLGLAIAQRAIRLHGGELGAHNNPEGGLTLSVRLPAAG
jgi:two-component system sensor histidine kinase CpxA